MTEFGRFGRYEAFEELGSGAMGKVYLAIDPLIDRMVAVKVIRTDLLAPHERAEFLERFRLEVRAAARCAHPNIVAVHDFADHEATPYIVMEHVPGRTISAILRGDPQERLAAAPVLAQAMLSVLEGLQAAHALGVVHRDIKPGNIMITPRGQVKITDFGIAKFGGGDLTQVGGVVGTPAYMSPEQAHGQPVDPRSDLFSVAAVLYEVLFGRAPFAGNNMTDTLMRLTGPEPADLGPLAGTPLGQVLRRGLAKPPGERFATAAEFGLALQAALSPDEGVAASPAATLPVPTPSPVAPSPVASLAAEVPVEVSSPIAAPAAPLSPAQRMAESSPPPVPSAPRPPTSPPPPTRGILPAAPVPAPTPEPTPVAFTLSPEQLAGASAALAFNVGPIARILVGKAAAQARSPEEFLDLLCRHASGAELAALRPKLLALF
jgi:eukaryotic-like serine/threonine-protein kinase